MSLRDALRIPASRITDERVYLERRRLLQTLAAAPALALAGCAEAEPPAPPKVTVTPEQARSGFRTTETLTRFEDVSSYNNFYEFGTGKADPSNARKTLKTSPWSVPMANRLPSSESAMPLTSERKSSMAPTIPPASTSQIRTSFPPAATRRPSREAAAANTMPPWPIIGTTFTLPVSAVG